MKRVGDGQHYKRCSKSAIWASKAWPDAIALPHVYSSSSSSRTSLRRAQIWSSKSVRIIWSFSNNLDHSFYRNCNYHCQNHNYYHNEVYDLGHGGGYDGGGAGYGGGGGGFGGGGGGFGGGGGGGYGGGGGCGSKKRSSDDHDNFGPIYGQNRGSNYGSIY